MAVSRLDVAVLLAGVAANVTGATFPIPVNSLVSIYATGGFGSGNVQIQVSPDGGTTWVNLGSTITTAGVVTTQVMATAIRAVLAGATAASLTVTAVFPDFN